MDDIQIQDHVRQINAIGNMREQAKQIGMDKEAIECIIRGLAPFNITDPQRRLEAGKMRFQEFEKYRGENEEKELENVPNAENDKRQMQLERMGRLTVSEVHGIYDEFVKHIEPHVRERLKYLNQLKKNMPELENFGNDAIYGTILAINQFVGASGAVCGRIEFKPDEPLMERMRTFEEACNRASHQEVGLPATKKFGEMVKSLEGKLKDLIEDDNQRIYTVCTYALHIAISEFNKLEKARGRKETEDMKKKATEAIKTIHK